MSKLSKFSTLKHFLTSVPVAGKRLTIDVLIPVTKKTTHASRVVSDT